MSSPILAGEDGAPLAPMGQGFEFGIDPTEDPELAVVCRKQWKHLMLTMMWEEGRCGAAM